MLDKMNQNSGASAQDIDAAATELGHAIPPDYAAFLLEHNGGEGFIGEHYLVLWTAGDIADYNRDYEVATYAPGFMLFGSNGAGESFAFDLNQPGPPVVLLPFIGMEPQYAVHVSASFKTLFPRLHNNPNLFP